MNSKKLRKLRKQPIQFVRDAKVVRGLGDSVRGMFQERYQNGYQEGAGGLLRNPLDQMLDHEAVRSWAKVAKPEATPETEAGKAPCNICGNQEFGGGPGGRRSALGPLPRCCRCQSLERHRALRSFWETIPARYLQEMSVLQFSKDLAADGLPFRAVEVSLYGGENSLDLQAIEREDNSYDLLICNHVLEHVENDIAAVSELLRVVRDEGWVLLSVPDPVGVAEMNDWGYPDWSQHGHYRVYNLEELLRRMKAAVPDMTILLVPIVDPVTGTKDCAFVCSRAEQAIAKVEGFYGAARPSDHPFAFERVG